MKTAEGKKDGGTQLNVDELGNESELTNEIFNESESLKARQCQKHAGKLKYGNMNCNL